MLGKSCISLLWHYMGLPYNYFAFIIRYEFLIDFLCWGRELIVLLSLYCNYMISVRRGFPFPLVLEIGCGMLM